MFSIKIIIFFIALNNIRESTCTNSSSNDNGDEFKNPHFYPNHIGIVQMFQWPFRYIARECEEYLGPQGFGGVQVSPIFENKIIEGRPWYELYQPISYIIKTRLGDENDFQNMINRCNKVGVRIYVDAILNHMASPGKGTLKGAAGSTALPAILYYPSVPYTSLDFHTCCDIRNWNDKNQLRRCRLASLPDLNQSKEKVRSKLINMLNHLISIGVAGFRMDASSFMEPSDLKEIFSKLNNLSTENNFPENSKPFIYHEAHNAPTDYINLGRIIEFSYEDAVNRVMRGQYLLRDINHFISNFNLIDSNNVVVDIDNHDSQRTYEYLSYKYPIQYKMGLAFMFAFPYGIPKLISSFAFDTFEDSPPSDINENIIDPAPQNNGKCQMNWNCEHRYYSVREMLKFAKNVQGEPFQNFVGTDNGQFGFCRGNKGFIAFNTGTDDMEMEMNVCLPQGTYCDIISGSYQAEICRSISIVGNNDNECSGNKIVVNENGKAIIKISANDDKKFVAFYKI